MRELGGGDGDQDLVRDLILRGSAAVETFCNRRFADDYVLPDLPGRTLPYDIERVVIALARIDWHAKDRDPNLRSSSVDGLASASYFDAGGRSAVLEELAAYRQPVAL